MDRQKRAAQPEKRSGNRRRSRVAGHIQTLGPLMEAKSRVIRGARLYANKAIAAWFVFNRDGLAADL